MMNSDYVKIVFDVQYINRLSSVMYDRSVDMSFVEEMCRLRLRCVIILLTGALYMRVVVDV